jgi:hypothetical protein
MRASRALNASASDDPADVRSIRTAIIWGLSVERIGENAMSFSRRNILSGALAAPAVIASAHMGSLAAAQTLKISHQFPGGTIDDVITATGCAASSARNLKSAPMAPLWRRSIPIPP